LDDGRTELWQWDTGRKIVVDDKSVSEVHYSKYSTAVLPLFVPGSTDNLWLFSGSGGINNSSLSFPSQYFTIAVTSDGVMAEREDLATKEYVNNKEVVVMSSTEGGTKKFKITVDDTGALSAVEVTTSWSKTKTNGPRPKLRMLSHFHMG
jgi:hypothetical protein